MIAQQVGICGMLHPRRRHTFTFSAEGHGAQLWCPSQGGREHLWVIFSFGRQGCFNKPVDTTMVVSRLAGRCPMAVVAVGVAVGYGVKKPSHIP